MNDTFDLHCHTNLSDAAPDQSPYAVCQSARLAGVQHLAITDHDRLLPDSLRRELCRTCGLDVIAGSEINGAITLSTGKAINAHIIGAWLPAAAPPPSLAKVLKINQEQDFKGYLKAMLEKLLSLGIDPSGCGDLNRSFEMAREQYPDSTHLGKNAIAHLLVKTGYCTSAKQAKDKYLSVFGERLAYISSHEFHHYASFEDVMAAVNTGVSVLAHLYYYQLNDEENLELIRRFKEMGGQALEVNYGFYSAERQNELMRLCKQFDLLPSAASDRHEGSSPFKLGEPAWFFALRDRCLKLHGNLNDGEAD